MRKIFLSIAALLAFTVCAYAESVTPPPPPCTTFGTTASTCIQGAGAGGTPSSINLANGTGLPVSTGVSGLGTGVAAALAATPNAAGGAVIQIGPFPWTPADGSGQGIAFTIDGTNVCNNSTNICGAYTQLGNIIVATAQWTYGASVNAAGASFAGLPVTVPNKGYAQSCSLNYTNATTPPSFVVLSKNTQTGAFYNNIGVQLTDANMGGKAVIVTCIYPAT